MTSSIRGLMGMGVGGTLMYYIVSFIVTTLITGTTSADTFFKGVVPIFAAAAVAWGIMMVAFRD